MARPIPAPPITVETEPFWNAARERRFVVPTCGACGKLALQMLRKVQGEFG